MSSSDPRDRRFHAWLRNNPGGTFSEYFDAFHVPRILEGHKHHSLGRVLSEGDWRTKGQAPFELICRIYTELTGTSVLARDLTVCDYGCGTLRVGAHFIDYLEPGHFIGLDVSAQLIEMGRQMHADLLQDKSPYLATSKAGIAQAAEMAPDLLFAFNVVCHIHPDEEETFYDNLHRLLAKPGAIALLQVIEHDPPLRYRESGWANRLAYYRARMAPLQPVPYSDPFLKPFEVETHQMQSHVLAFQRPL